MSAGTSCVELVMWDQAIQAWRDNSGFGRVQLVKQYFLCVEGEQA